MLPSHDRDQVPSTDHLRGGLSRNKLLVRVILGASGNPLPFCYFQAQGQSNGGGDPTQHEAKASYNCTHASKPEASVRVCTTDIRHAATHFPPSWMQLAPQLHPGKRHRPSQPPHNTSPK